MAGAMTVVPQFLLEVGPVAKPLQQQILEQRFCWLSTSDDLAALQRALSGLQQLESLQLLTRVEVERLAARLQRRTQESLAPQHSQAPPKSP
ncbi:MAG: hypothetical protein ACO289_11495 [Prochlorococcaceae cyanobacterium]